MQTLRLSLRIAVAAFLLLCSLSAHTDEPRSRAARAAFQRANPCPSTQQARGPCPGFVVAHILPLCAGGEDRPTNMQWQTRPESFIKDRHEWRLCRLLKRHD